MPMGQFIALYSQTEQVLLLYYTPFCTRVKEHLGYRHVFPFKLHRVPTEKTLNKDQKMVCRYYGHTHLTYHSGDLQAYR